MIKHLSHKSVKELESIGLIPIELYTISGLYYQYKSMQPEDLSRRLDKIPIFKEIDGKFYPYKKVTLKKIKENPRNVSLTFDAHEILKKSNNEYKVYKKIAYLVKSTSRFFLKPDIGEIFDQIPYRDLLLNLVDAVAYTESEGNTPLPDTDGEHFVLTASLLRKDFNNDYNRKNTEWN